MYNLSKEDLRKICYIMRNRDDAVMNKTGGGRDGLDKPIVIVHVERQRSREVYTLYGDAATALLAMWEIYSPHEHEDCGCW